MWWFAALHANLLMLCRRLGAGPAAPLLDAGCGTGGFLARIAAADCGGALFGIDADAEACRRAAQKSRRPICTGSVNALPFADKAFAAIVSADVLCHRDVDERAALAQFHRVLRDGGVLILNLPSYRWLLSRHDRAVCNVRRYTRGGVARLLQACGFRLVFASYWNVLLFPLMVASRKLIPAASGDGSDVKLYPAPIDMLCRVVTAFEGSLLRRGMRFPFGGSLLAVAAKEAIVPNSARGSGHA